VAGNCHPFDAGDCSTQSCSNHCLSGRAELELRFPSSQHNQLLFAFHFLCSQVINRGGIFDRYFKLLLGSFFPFKESLTTIHPPLIQTRGLLATCYPLPPRSCGAPAQHCPRQDGLPSAASDPGRRNTIGIRREMLTLRRSHGNMLLQSRRHICQGSEICHLIAWISMLWMRSHHTKSRSGLMP